jgi:hypothetical protein
MKKTSSTSAFLFFLGSLLFTALLFSCSKNNTADDITLTASTTQAAVGQQISVTASTTANGLKWSVNPASNAAQTYGTTTEKVNYYTFSQAGDYVISVRASRLHLDSLHHCNHADSSHHYADSTWNHHIDSIWHHDGHGREKGRKGNDSSSITIKVI